MIEIQTEDKTVTAEVADNILKRALGLSFRTKGKMLFKFRRDTSAAIDMMLMRDSLYLYFMNSEKEVIHAENAEPWYKLPRRLLHRPDENYRYLLESFEELDIEEGEELEF
ncbi:DUF192 domain-containing protein [Candidatus Nanohalobium constans]|uniref:DUF192 domain-containing protein n=1 Tax=Candidatus Nanohalobium constans TaxID=2565781 RepID=A0A5Q0UGX9_9ARCH|nr:DUF192 domain-containing protein [Candidatus Nanohalobium constans]QGA80844.1 hypothetical protein LC1Nh_0963 [Candidatus Nanohalobium constans]